MTKRIRLGLCLLLFLLGAMTGCGQGASRQSKQPASTSSASHHRQASSDSSVTSQSSSASSSASGTGSAGTPASTEIATATEQAEVLPPLNTAAVLKADYTSMAGTWQNADQEELTFDERGLATAGLSADLLDIDQHGILLLDVQTGPRSNATLYIVPAQTALPSGYLNGRSDDTDTARDRIFLSSDLTVADVARKAYYHLSAD